MPRPGPRRQFVGARMSVEQIDGLRATAELVDVDVSEVIRQAVDEYLARHATFTVPTSTTGASGSDS